MSSSWLVAGLEEGPAPVQPRRWLALAVLCVSLLIVSLDTTILNIALPDIVRQLHASETQLQWVVDVYACVFAGLLLVAGSVGDRIGRKRLFCGGLVIFGAASAASAFSSDLTWLDLSRSLMGVGAACIMPATLSIISDIFRDDQTRARAIGIWSGTTGLGVAIGPIAGGWLLVHYWWGSIFLINVPFSVLGILGALWLVPESKDPQRRPIDWLGAVSSAAGLTLLVWSIINVSVNGWGAFSSWGAASIAVVILGGFIAWERHTTFPLLVIEPFGDRRFSMAMLGGALSIFSLMSALFLLTQYLQFSLGYSPLATGVRILPIAVVLGVAALSSSQLDKWFGTKVVITAGMLIVAGGLWQLTTVTVTSGYSHALAGMMLLGAGAGFIIAPATSSVMAALPRERAGVGSGINSSAQEVGGALGVAVIGTALSSRYRAEMAPLLVGHAVPLAAKNAILGSLGGALTVAHMAGGAMGKALALAARLAFVEGMDLALAVGAIVLAVSAVVVAVALPARAKKRAQPKGQGQ
jgi:EmrB/QacA subfamily drug resistance transporter